MTTNEEMWDRINSIQEKVGYYNMLKSTKEIEGKAIQSMSTVSLDGANYMIIRTSDNNVLFVSYTKCGDQILFDSVPEFKLLDLFVEEIDFGFTTHVDHVLDLYESAGFLFGEDKGFIKQCYPELREEANKVLKASRIEYMLQEAVKKEDFKQAEKLKRELDELR